MLIWISDGREMDSHFAAELPPENPFEILFMKHLPCWMGRRLLHCTEHRIPLRPLKCVG